MLKLPDEGGGLTAAVSMAMANGDKQRCTPFVDRPTPVSSCEDFGISSPGRSQAGLVPCMAPSRRQGGRADRNQLPAARVAPGGAMNFIRAMDCLHGWLCMFALDDAVFSCVLAAPCYERAAHILCLCWDQDCFGRQIEPCMYVCIHRYCDFEELNARATPVARSPTFPLALSEPLLFRARCVAQWADGDQ